MAYHLHNKYHHHQNTSTNITNCKNREKNCVLEIVLKHSDIDERSQTHSLPVHFTWPSHSLTLSQLHNVALLSVCKHFI